MSEAYTVLARRYRSQNFSALVGQEAVAQTLKNAVASGRVAHAFLFTGTRGVGKTSSARILAKALNCPNVKDGEPCGVCETCRAIARGEDMDVIEIDAASNNGVDQIRDLRQSAGIRPAHSRYKVYIVDEVHMLSGAAFNALLKTLEEPPSHVKFILATTDVHKVPATIISRCQRFDFKNIPVGKIVEHLKSICDDEKIHADDDALHRIARLANGSMRDALSLLDRVLSLGEKHITEALLESLLGRPAIAVVAELVGAIAAGQAGDAVKAADRILADGSSPDQLLGDVVDFLRSLMLIVVCGHDTELVDAPGDLRPVFTNLAPRFDAPTLVHMIALAEQTLRSLKATTMPRPLFDTLVIRLALNAQFTSMQDAPAQANAAPDPQKKNDVASPPEHMTPVAATPLPALPYLAPSPPVASPPVVRRPAPVVYTPPAANATPDPAETYTPSPDPADGAPHSSVPDSDLPALYLAVREHLKGHAPSFDSTVGEYGKLVGYNTESGLAAIALPAHLSNFANERVRVKMEESVSAVADKKMKLSLVFASPPPKQVGGTVSGGTHGGSGGPTRPAYTAQAAPVVQRVPPEVMDAVRSHPLIQTLTEKLGGNVTSVELID